MSATNGTLYADEDLPLHSHAEGGHSHTVLTGETELYDRAGNVRQQRPGDPPAWFPKGAEHGIRCKVPGTVYFNSTPG